MIYRLEVPFYNEGGIDTLDLYLEAGNESPGGEQWVETMEMLAEATQNGSMLRDAIKVIKNLGAPDEEDFGWQEYFPYLRCPDLYGQAVQCIATTPHPERPEYGELKVTLTWIRVFKPYLRSLREMTENFRFVKDEDKKQLVKLLKAK